MGDFDDAVTAAMAVWFGPGMDPETVTYKGTGIPGHISYGGRSDGENARTAILEVRVSDVPNPTYRDTAVINGVTWRVYRDQSQEVVIQGDGYTWKLPITRDERPRW